MEPILHKNFKKKFKKLSSKVQNQFFERIEIFRENPFDSLLNNHSVEKRFPGCRSINITGDYRAIYKYENDIVTFVNIGTHSQLYK
jgi:addiction module RelE/StbE family toxin